MMYTGKVFVCFTIRQTSLKSKFSWKFVLSHVISCTMLILFACGWVNSYFPFGPFPISVFALLWQMSHACWLKVSLHVRNMHDHFALDEIPAAFERLMYEHYQLNGVALACI